MAIIMRTKRGDPEGGWPVGIVRLRCASSACRGSGGLNCRQRGAIAGGSRAYPAAHRSLWLVKTPSGASSGTGFRPVLLLG